MKHGIIKIRFLLPLSVALFYSSCISDVYNPEVCFQENVLPIFVTKCSMSGCHNSLDNKAHYDLTTYEGILKGVTANHPLQSEVYNQIRGINPSMPVGQKLDQKDISYIKIWIKMGAKNSSNCSGCDTLNVTYNVRIKPIITNWCVGCHTAGNAGGGYDLSNYTGVSTSITDNRLIGSLKHLAGFSEMPKNTNKLSDCDLKAVEKWVNAGHLNN